MPVPGAPEDTYLRPQDTYPHHRIPTPPSPGVSGAWGSHLSPRGRRPPRTHHRRHEWPSSGRATSRHRTGRMNTFTSRVSALLPQLAAGEHRTPGTLPPTASPTRGDIPQRLRPRRRIASRASPTRQAKDTSRACPSPARRRIPISGHKIPILTTGYLPPPSPGVSGAWGSHLAPGGPLLVRWQSAASGTLIITLPTTPGVSFCAVPRPLSRSPLDLEQLAEDLLVNVREPA